MMGIGAFFTLAGLILLLPSQGGPAEDPAVAFAATTFGVALFVVGYADIALESRRPPIVPQRPAPDGSIRVSHDQRYGRLLVAGSLAMGLAGLGMFLAAESFQFAGLMRIASLIAVVLFGGGAVVLVPSLIRPPCIAIERGHLGWTAGPAGQVRWADIESVGLSKDFGQAFLVCDCSPAPRLWADARAYYGVQRPRTSA